MLPVIPVNLSVNSRDTVKAENGISLDVLAVLAARAVNVIFLGASSV